MDNLLPKLGITDKNPHPDPVKFADEDPLGAGTVKVAASLDTILSEYCN